jgi:plastocyanin
VPAGLSRARSVWIGCVAAALAACGGSSAPPAPTPDNPNQMVISSSGVLTPKEITITAGSRVLFINNHSRPHFMASDPHPEHNACPEMDPIGVLSPGQRRETSNFVIARTCGLHDHDEFDNDNLKGRIIIR